MSKFTNKVGSLDVFENEMGDISIVDIDDDYSAIGFDECMAEKLCQAIMKVAKQIREHNNG